MKVSKLIEILQTVDQNQDVILYDPDEHDHYAPYVDIYKDVVVIGHDYGFSHCVHRMYGRDLEKPLKRYIEKGDLSEDWRWCEFCDEEFPKDHVVFSKTRKCPYCGKYLEEDVNV